MSVNGNPVNASTDKGYAIVKDWKSGDQITLNMDMPIEMVSADPRVKQNVGKRAVQRGPLVYCLEEIDNSKNFADLNLAADTSFEVKDEPGKLGGIKEIEADIRKSKVVFHPLLHLG